MRERSVSVSIAPKADALHCALNFGIFHKRAPDKSTPEVLGHEHRDANIDSDDIRRIPLGLGIKRINKAMAIPTALAITRAHRAQDLNRIVRQKRQRTCRGAGHERAVDAAMFGWSAPGTIAFGGVRSGDAPHVLGEMRVALAQVEAELLVGPRRHYRVIKIVRVLVAATAKIEPGVRVLMDEQWVFGTDEFMVLVFEYGPRKDIPTLRRRGV